MDVRLLAAVALFCVGTLADVATTYAAITAGPFVEGSPIGRRLIGRFGLLRGMALTKVLGLAVMAVPVAVASRDRRTVLLVMFGGVGLLSLVAAGHNVIVLASP